jgi:hypothetical protein
MWVCLPVQRSARTDDNGLASSRLSPVRQADDYSDHGAEVRAHPEAGAERAKVVFPRVGVGKVQPSDSFRRDHLVAETGGRGASRNAAGGALDFVVGVLGRTAALLKLFVGRGGRGCGGGGGGGGIVLVRIGSVGGPRAGRRGRGLFHLGLKKNHFTKPFKTRMHVVNSPDYSRLNRPLQFRHLN